MGHIPLAEQDEIAQTRDECPGDSPLLLRQSGDIDFLRNRQQFLRRRLHLPKVLNMAAEICLMKHRKLLSGIRSRHSHFFIFRKDLLKVFANQSFQLFSVLHNRS